MLFKIDKLKWFSNFPNAVSLKSLNEIKFYKKIVFLWWEEYIYIMKLNTSDWTNKLPLMTEIELSL